jgi:hypothetical protein
MEIPAHIVTHTLLMLLLLLYQNQPSLVCVNVPRHYLAHPQSDTLRLCLCKTLVLRIGNKYTRTKTRQISSGEMW